MAKSGKSTTAGTSPKPNLYIDIEGGTKFLDVRKRYWDPSREAPPANDGTWDTCIVTVLKYDDALKAYEWLQAGKHDFESVVVDSISELQQKLVDKVTNRDQAKQQDWGDILRGFMGFLRDFRDLTAHPYKPMQSVCLVAMSSTGPDDKLHPFAQGQSRTFLPYLFDILGAMHVDSWTDNDGSQQEVYRLLVGNNRIYATGERVGRHRIPGYIDNPSIPELLDMVFGPVPTTEGE